MSARPPSRRELAGQLAITTALDLITTARTDPGNGALVDHTARIYAELHRPTDPTGSAGRLGRLITTLAYCAAHSLEQWLNADPVAAQQWLASLAVHSGGKG